MSATRQARRAVGAALTIGAFAAALAATPAAATTQTSAAARAGEVFVCGEVAAELPNVFARDCDTTHWGPVANFVVIHRHSRAAFHCATGWAEGSLWLNGQNCRRIPAT
ncbi:hypothetical protein FAF44_05440 [Nonomuraea sp. MG754425]|uniref:hypothetical protein n=1 Tax=Nonomuraea sp. MG754425 TaxID=2570319 RepID=UPI001F433506|nr:hypothetical protein [Nonomuraea sp. MG754425]MCF6467855.1 hypothetical protein [Nonomuraea sp. MG754425]